MTHGDYIKRRDHILESVQNYIDDDDAKREGRIIAAQAIDALVLAVIGEDEQSYEFTPSYTSAQYKQLNDGVHYGNMLKTEQRKTVQGDK